MSDTPTNDLNDRGLREAPATPENILRKFDMDELMNCMRCGFCLPACPTYRETGRENASPRGRIALMKGVALGELAVNQEFADNMYLCLGCRACESACPAGVRYGRLIETAREVIEEVKAQDETKRGLGGKDMQQEQAARQAADWEGNPRLGQDIVSDTTGSTVDTPTVFAREISVPAGAAIKRSGREILVRNFVFKKLFLHPKRIEMAGTMLWLAQTLGLQKLADRLGLMRVLPRPMAEMQKAIGPLASPAKRRQRRKVVQSSLSETRLRIGMFKGCVMDVLFYETNQSTVRVLSKAGCEVVFVEDQVCCGALHAHSGEEWGAMDLAKGNIVAFEAVGVDFIVNNAGGCGAALKEYAHLLRHEPDWLERAKQFVAKVRDANELLAELPPLAFTRPLNARVTYQDSCHLRHGQGIWREPRDLIRQIPGVTYVELENADQCCGSAGIYNITNFDMSMRILDGKMHHVANTKADIIVTANPGCLVQMRQGIIRAGLQGKVEGVHIMDLLDRAL